MPPKLFNIDNQEVNPMQSSVKDNLNPPQAHQEEEKGDFLKIKNSTNPEVFPS